MEERISGIEDTTEETDSSAKKMLNLKNKQTNKQNLLTQNIQEIWNNMKRSNPRTTGIEEREESQLKYPENIFDKIIEENFPNLKKAMPIKVQEAYRTPNDWIREVKPHTT